MHKLGNHILSSSLYTLAQVSVTIECQGLTCHVQKENTPSTVPPFAMYKYDSSPYPPLFQGVCKAQGEADKEIEVCSCCPHHLFVLLSTAHLVPVTAPEHLWSKAHPFENKRTFLLN